MGILEDLGIRGTSVRLRSTPKTFGELRFEDWLWILDRSPENEDDSKTKARALSEKQYQAGTGKQTIAGSDCQTDSLNDTTARTLNGYIRTNFYADNASGKKSAKAKGDEIRREYEGEVFVRVYRVYCKDSRRWGWSVWVKPTGTKERVRNYWADVDGKMTKIRGTEEMTVIAPRSEKAGGFSEASSRDWTKWRGASKKKVACPKCFAPKDYPCINDKGIESGIYINDKGEPMTPSQASALKAGRGMNAEVRAVRTNAHRERVTLYLEKKKGLVEVPQSIKGQTGIFEEKVERRPPTDQEKERYLLRVFNDSQVERFEDIEESGEYSLSDVEALMNKKQKPKYEKWIEYGVEQDGEIREE